MAATVDPIWMTPTERAQQVVKWFQSEGHPYYDELLSVIEQSIWAAETDAIERAALEVQKLGKGRSIAGQRVVYDSAGAVRALKTERPA
jgi:hypothetical protein